MIAALLGVVAQHDAHGQGYPTRPIRLIAPYPTGGGIDTVESSVSFTLASRVNVENLELTGLGKINGTGNKITGAVLAEGADVLTAGAVSGNVEISYSKCAIDKAIGGASIARPLYQRSWAHIY